MSNSAVPVGLDPNIMRREIVYEVDAESLEKMRKSATVKGHIIYCDEGPLVGGDDTAPSPLSFFCSSIAF